MEQQKGKPLQSFCWDFEPDLKANTVAQESDTSSSSFSSALTVQPVEFSLMLGPWFP
jgi:hypothetical protein